RASLMCVPRFRLRTLMIAIVIVGVSISIGRETLRLRRLSSFYHRKACEYERSEAFVRGFATSCAMTSSKAMRDAQSWHKGRVPDDFPVPVGETIPSLADATISEAQRANLRELYRGHAKAAEEYARAESAAAAERTKLSECYAELKQKYDRAARRP